MAAKGPRFLPLLSQFSRDFLRYGGRRAWVGLGLMLLGSLTDGLSLAMLVPILALVMDTGHDTSWWRRLLDQAFVAVGAVTQFERLVWLVVIYGALMAVRGVVGMCREVQSAALQIGFLQHLRARLVEVLAAAPWTRLGALRHARITHLMSGDLARVSTGVSFLLQAAVALCTLAAICVIAVLLAPLLAAIAFALLAGIGFSVWPLVRRSQALGRHVTQANLTMLDATGQFLGGLKLAVSQNLQGPFVASFRETLQLLTRRQVDNTLQAALARLALNLLVAGVAAAIVLLGFGVMHTPTPVLITLLVTIWRMSQPVTTLQQGAQQVAYAAPAYEHMAAVIDELAAEPEDRGFAAGLPFPPGPVRFERVSFRHTTDGEPGAAAGGDLVWRGVSRLDFTLMPGEFVGLAGPSGAGKTTFIDLLVGLLAPQSGRISVGGRALEGEVLAGWRTGLSYVSQDPFLFHDSIRRNLAWASPAASEAEMWRCLALVGADDVVRRMDKGLDTVVGERGALMSGGERQRIALARALLRRPRLLVLDEATNAIDIAAERALLDRLEQIEPRPTVVMIAHRLESLALCSRVVRLDKGVLTDPPAEAQAAAQAGGA